MVGKDPFRTDKRSNQLGKARHEKMQHLGDWWYARSYYVWVFFGLIWVWITIAVAISDSPKLAWVCGMVAFLHLYRGWEIYKNHALMENLQEENRRMKNEKKEGK